MASIEVEPFRPEMTSEACRMLAVVFGSNPGHIAAFAKNEAFFRSALRVLRGPMLVVTNGSRVFGLIHWVDSSQRRAGVTDKFRLVPVLVAQLWCRADGGSRSAA